MEVFALLGLKLFLSFGFGLIAQVDAVTPSTKVETTSSAATESPSWWMLLANPLNLMVLALILFWLVVILPQQRTMRGKQQALQKMLDELKKNDRVVTSAGIHGIVVSKSPEAGTVTLRIDDASNAKLTVERATIIRVGTETSKD
jgi:preprotein translocase YajC subunit